MARPFAILVTAHLTNLSSPASHSNTANSPVLDCRQFAPGKGGKGGLRYKPKSYNSTGLGTNGPLKVQGTGGRAEVGAVRIYHTDDDGLPIQLDVGRLMLREDELPAVLAP
eukprot:gene10352-biopygen7431